MTATCQMVSISPQSTKWSAVSVPHPDQDVASFNACFGGWKLLDTSGQSGSLSMVVLSPPSLLRKMSEVVWLPNDFRDQVFRGVFPAIELEHALLTRQPEDIFAAEDRRDWDDWVQFFSRTREPDGRRKGLVEIEL